MTSKSYHRIYEELFKAVSHEKRSYLKAIAKSTKSKAADRLSSYGGALRTTITAGVPVIKATVVKAVIGHIIQTLPIAGGSYCEPLTVDYLKTLSAVFQYEAHVEHLLQDDWSGALEFCLDGLAKIGDDLDEQTPHSMALTSSSLRSDKSSSAMVGIPLEELLECILALVSSSNAPLLGDAAAICDTMVRILTRVQETTKHRVCLLALSTINRVLLRCNMDQISLAQSTAQIALPIVAQLWLSSKLPALKDEILIFLITNHLHLEHSIYENGSLDLKRDLDYLVEVLQSEYSNRAEREKLHMDDLSLFISDDTNAIGGTVLELSGIRLRSTDTRAESCWGLLQVLGLLTKLLNSLNQKLEMSPIEEDEMHHRKKRRRTDVTKNVLITQVSNRDALLKMAALQALPFIVQDVTLPDSIYSDLLSQLVDAVNDKDSKIATWAMIGIVR